MVVDAASHGIIDPGSKADIRPAYQPPLPSPRRPLPSSHRVVPWSLPLEDYGVGTSLSSPRVLSSSTRSRAEASAALSSAFSSLSHIPRHCRLSCISIYSTLVLPPRSSSARTFAALVSRVLQNHTCVRPPHSSPVRVLWSSAHIHSFFPHFSEFFMLVYFVCNIDLFIAIFSLLENLFVVYYFVVIFMCLDSIPDGINRSGQV